MNLSNRLSIALVSLSLCACTFVNIEGDHNSVNDTGGHGVGVRLPERSTNSAPIQRLIPPK